MNATEKCKYIINTIVLFLLFPIKREKAKCRQFVGLINLKRDENFAR